MIVYFVSRICQEGFVDDSAKTVPTVHKKKKLYHRLNNSIFRDSALGMNV